MHVWEHEVHLPLEVPANSNECTSKASNTNVQRHIIQNKKLTNTELAK